MTPFTFPNARPVWEAGKETEKNRSLLFRALLVPPANGEKTVLSCTGHTKFQIFINGAFFAEGPARTAHGFHRVSVYELDALLTNKTNIVSFLVAGYNVNSFSLTDQPSFFCAEISRGETCLYATGGEREFETAAFDYRIRKAARYSYQRPFTEGYVFDAGYDLFMTDPGFQAKPVPLEVTGDGNFITRDVYYCDYPHCRAETLIATGSVAPAEEKGSFSDRSIDNAGVTLGGFQRTDLEYAPADEVLAFRHTVKDRSARPAFPVALPPDGFAVWDFGRIRSGFLRVTVTPGQDTVIYAVFNQKLKNGDETPDPGQDACENVIKWVLQGGRSYDLVAFEPYTFRVVELFALYAPVLVTNVSVFEERCPDWALTNLKRFDDPALQKVYDAGVATFCQNATDIFMDCPSRERAGWLCDAFFTGRSEWALTGRNVIERAFLENFLLPETFRDIPEGMLPMCYPSDHNDGGYIPNWAMWYALELKEHYERTGEYDLVDEAEEKLYMLCKYFERFENADGLLQKLEGWVFVEWSKANDFVQDVNYPFNMLYAAFLDAVGGLYNDAGLKAKAAKLRSVIREKAFDGTFFVDNALLDETGAAVPTENRTETCQYYAFFTGVADPEKDRALFDCMMGEFGPGRDPAKTLPEIHPANAFVGNFLRLELLRRTGRSEQLKKEIVSFFLPMAEDTGTLWENMTDFASCCHGFASAVTDFLS
ncbi:MAG: hypothetical protein IJK02_07525 [Clostridia bacterium]|nr:hypothetical protein [Clostridia bacterium]